MLLLAIYSIFILFIWVQIAYHLLFYKKITKPHINCKQNFSPSVSIVIALHNEEKHLKKLISLLLAQQYPTFEIILVNDRSTDNSLSIIKFFDDERLQYINIEKTPNQLSPKKYALTTGITKAQHEWVLLTDADCYPASDRWIETMVAQIKEKTEIVIGVSPNKGSDVFSHQFIQYETFYTFLQYATATIMRKAYMGVGRNLMYKKTLFLKQGFKPYEKILSGDDDLFVNLHATPINTEISLSPNAYTYTYPKDDWKSYFKQKKRHNSVGRHYRISSKLYTGLFYFSFGLSFLGLGLLFYEQNLYFTISFLLMIIVKYATFIQISKRQYFSINIAYILLFDFMYFSYLASSTFRMVWKNEIEWGKK